MKMKNLLKKAFLLLALIGGASSAWAGDVQFSAKNNATSDQSFTNGTTTEITANITISGGKIYAVNNQGSAKKLQTSSGFCMTNNNTYFKIVLNRSLAVGDIISAKYTGGIKDTSEKGIRVSSSETTSGNLSPIPACSATSSSDTKLGSTLSYTVQVGDEYVGKTTLYVYRAAGATQYFDEFKVTSAAEPTSEVLKSSSAVKVGESTLTKDAANDGYSVDVTTITLSNDISAVSTPTNVALVKTITYDDESTKDEDVDVTFDGTITDGYYIGTASIGLIGSVTNYTVKVKKDDTPTLTLSGDAGTVTLKSFEPTGSVKVTVSGTNLTGSTFTAPTVDGVTITPASVGITDGAFSQEFTITTTATTAASTVIGFVHTGATTKNYTLTYSKTAKRSLSQSDVSAATTWDWTKAYDAADVQLTGTTSPTKSEEFLLSDLAEVKNDANFNARALKVVTEFATRYQGSVYFMQGNSIKFTTTVPGKIDVDFSNTGGDRPYRYLRVNGTMTEFKSGSSTKESATNIAVPAGEVVIDFYIPDASDPQSRAGDVVGATMCRIYKIVFTPTDAASVSGTITDAGWSSFSSIYPLDLSTLTATSGATAYYASTADNTSVTLTPTTAKVPGNTGLMIKGTAGEEFTITTTSDETTAIDGNLLKGHTITGTVSASPEEGAGTYHYVFGYESSSVYGFYNLASATSVSAGKAYLEITKLEQGARALRISFGDNITGIDQIDNGQLTIDNSQDGKFIENGKLVIFKNGKKFNANGAILK